MKNHRLVTAFLLLALSFLAVSCELDEMDSETGKYFRAFMWILDNSPHSILRLEMVQMKADLEQGDPDIGPPIDIYGLLERADAIENKPDEFGAMNEKDFCITAPALRHIAYSWIARIASDNGLDAEAGKYEKKMNEALEADWYAGFFEEEQLHDEVDRSAKEYVKKFAGIGRPYEPAPGDDVEKESIERYLLKPFCAEPGIVQPAMEGIFGAIYREQYAK